MTILKNALKNTLLLGVAALAFCATAGVYAEQAADKAPRAAMNEKMQQNMHARMEKHRAQLHDKLKLSAAQEPAWKSFTEAVMPSMSAMHHAPRSAQDKKAMESMTSPERMEKKLAHAKERLERMQKKLDALKTFYAVLSPEQQKTFDEAHQAMHKAMRQNMQKMHSMGRMQHRGESKMEMEKK